MKNDNDSYTVTSPDLMLTENGMSILVSSTDQQLINSIKDLFEQMITSSIVFYIQPTKTTDTTLPWLWHVSRTSDITIVDLDTCAWVDIATMLTKDTGLVTFVGEKKKKRDAIKLIHATAKYPVLLSKAELIKYLQAELNEGKF